MKKFIIMNMKIVVFSIVLFLAFFSGCNEEQPANMEGEWLDLNQQNHIISQRESFAYFGVQSNTQWSISCSDSWLTFSQNSGEGNGLIRVSASANNMVENRETIVTVTSKGGITKRAFVTQEGFPLIIAGPEGGPIGGNVAITGKNLDWITEIWFGNVKGTIHNEGLDPSLLNVSIPDGQDEGDVDLKVVYHDHESDKLTEWTAGAFYLHDKDIQLNANLALYAGSLVSDIKVICGSEPAAFSASTGNLAIFAFDGIYLNNQGGNVDYASIYGDDRVITSTNRTYWQGGSSAHSHGEIPNGQPAPTNWFWIGLDYSATTRGSVTFDRIVLYNRDTSSALNIHKYTIEISDDNLNWTKVVRAEDTQQIPGNTVAVIHQLTELVTAKYVRFVVVDRTSGVNVGLGEFMLYRTKLKN